MTVEQITASLRLWEAREARAHKNHQAARARGDHARERHWIAYERKAEEMIDRRRKQLEAAGKAWRPPIIRLPDATFEYVFGAKGGAHRSAGHYTAGRRCKDASELLHEARLDHAFHKSRGWGGLSYEWMVADDGTLLLGNPTDRKGAAVAGQNTGMVNVCMPATTGDRPTPAQQRTLRWLVANAHTSALPKRHRSPVDLRTVPMKGHKDYPGQSTACPGLFIDLYRSKGADS